MVAVVKSLLLGLVDLRNARQRLLRFVLFAALLLSLVALPASAVTRYVKPSGNDTATGRSWALAKRTVEATLNYAQSGDEIWVAAGTYNERITLKAGVGLYGGFTGTETLRTERNFRTNVTILDGNAAGTVVKIATGAGANTVLDGFTIQNGLVEANNARGGGLYCSAASPTIRYCVFRNNRAGLRLVLNDGQGGGAYFSYSNAQVSSCTFEGNWAHHGGGIYVVGGSATISDCVLTRNFGLSTGGGIHSGGSTLRLINSTLVENTDNCLGGAFFQDSGTTYLANNLIAFNSTGVFSIRGAIDLRSNCVYGSEGPNYVNIADATGTNGNIAVDPQLASLAVGNLHLQPSSPCIGAGDNAEAVGAEDMDGQMRLMGGSVDIGADEADGTSWSVTGRILYVSPTGSDTSSGLSWALAKRTVGGALDAAVSGDEIWVAAGSYWERVRLKAGVGLYGGFSGTETQRSQRDFRVFQTILNAGGTGTVVTVAEGAISTTVLDGFTIRGGNALYGGGLYVYESSPVIRHCAFINNVATESGGGAFLVGSYSHVSSSRFQGNQAENGGGIYPGGGLVTVSDCVLTNNTATNCGGAIDAPPTEFHLLNSTLVGNTGGSGGGGIWLQYTDALIVNNIIAFNSTGVQEYPSTWAGLIDLRSNCVYGNAGGNYVAMADPVGTNGNISVDPLFVDRAAGNLHLLPASPCIDAGDSSLVAGLEDIDGQARVHGASVDIGADEGGSPNLPIVAVLSLSPSTAFSGAENVIGTVTLNSQAPTPGIVVHLSSSNISNATVPAYVRVPEGQSSITFPIACKTTGETTTVTIRAATTNDTGKTAVLTVTDVPQVYGTSPASGPVGTSVRIEGRYLSLATAVQFNGREASSFTVLSDSVILATVPIGATTGKIRITATGSSGISYFDFRVLELSSLSLSPPSVAGGIAHSTGTVTLTGVAPGGGVVVTLSSSNTAAATVPASVTVPEGQSTVTFPITSKTVASTAVVTVGARIGSGDEKTATLTVVALPTISSFTPASGYAGTSVTIDGTNLLGATAVRFGGVAAATFTVVSGTRIVATVPPGAVTGKVSVTTPDGTTTSADDFTVLIMPAPELSALSVSPETIIGGVASATGRVTLTAAAPAGGMVVALSSSNTAATVPAFVTVPEGQSQAAFAVTSRTVSATTAVTIRATAGSVTRTATLTVNPVPPASTMRDITLAGDGSLWVLKVTPSSLQLAKVNGSSLQNGASTPIPFGWTPVAIASGSDGKTRLLWSGPDGQLSLMTFNAQGVRESYVVIGTYPGVVSKDIVIAADGSVRILQVSATLARILKVTGSSVQYGPTVPVPSGWTPVAIAVGADNKTRLLWSGPGGAVSVMTFNAQGARESYQAVGTYPGVASKDIAVAGDGSVRILQVSATLVRILKVAGSTLQYGAALTIPSGWTPVAITSGLDDRTRLLWSGPGGTMGVMTMNASGAREAYVAMGPY